jgi:hypothetical protein
MRRARRSTRARVPRIGEGLRGEELEPLVVAGVGKEAALDQHLRLEPSCASASSTAAVSGFQGRRL